MKHLCLAMAVVGFCHTAVFSQEKIARPAAGGKKISNDLFGLFFEDINYSADGGLYAELVQNRSFEYNPAEKKEWHPLSFWEYITPGFSYGKFNVETSDPIHANNPHYGVLEIEHVGTVPPQTGDGRARQPLPASITTGRPGVGIKNGGFGNIITKKGGQYHFSFSAKLLSQNPVDMYVSLQDQSGKLLAESKLVVDKKNWTRYSTSLTTTDGSDSTALTVVAVSKGKLALDVVSLFPANTFKGRENGLRPDMAQLLADMKPRFIRFPGGCVAHGDGLDNMYRWKNTIGPMWERKEQRNLWGYHQTAGLGYYEYFQFCEDIGAKPLPVVPAAVSCQNSGGTWRIGGTGQQALPMEDMQEYIQEVLDLIEWANGPATSTWGAKRAAAGHPAPFNLEYVGIGNEDKITPEFEQRFKMIFDAVKQKHPEITVIGTSGPFHSGEDFDKGWKVADTEKVPMIDEHYYTNPEWFISNQYRYDQYNRSAAGVYLGEYASWGNTLRNALAEAIYMVGMERNGDVVRMASYAPLFAKKDFTQWTTDMVFFDNTTIVPTPNYHVQKMFSANQGDYYFGNVVATDKTDSTLAASCVQDTRTGDIILKLVNYGNGPKPVKVNLSAFKKIETVASRSVLTGKPDAVNTFENISNIAPVEDTCQIAKKFDYQVPAMSLTVIRIKVAK